MNPTIILALMAGVGILLVVVALAGRGGADPVQAGEVGRARLAVPFDGPERRPVLAVDARLDLIAGGVGRLPIDEQIDLIAMGEWEIRQILKPDASLI